MTAAVDQLDNWSSIQYCQGDHRRELLFPALYHLCFSKEVNIGLEGLEIKV